MSTNSTVVIYQKVDHRTGKRFKQHMAGDVGIDLEVWNPEAETTVIPPNSFVDLPTGMKIKFDDNSWGILRPRSSTNFKKRLIVMEGTIDPGFTGLMFVAVYNPSSEPVTIYNGDSLAQLIPVPKFNSVEIKEVLEMPKTERGDKCFGSTGGIKV